MTTILEKVNFRTLPGIDDATIVAAAKNVSAWARAQPGFQYRTLVRDQGGWSDLVYWQDMGSAKAASDAFMSEPGNVAFAKMIDPASMSIAHLAMLHSAAPE